MIAPARLAGKAPGGTSAHAPARPPARGLKTALNCDHTSPLPKGDRYSEFCGQDPAVPRLRPGLRLHCWRARVLRGEGARERASALPGVPVDPAAGAYRARFSRNAHGYLRAVWARGQRAIPAEERQARLLQQLLRLCPRRQGIIRHHPAVNPQDPKGPPQGGLFDFAEQGAPSAGVAPSWGRPGGRLREREGKR